MNDPNYRRGVMIVAFGALMLAPDSLMVRLMAMEQWPTVFWRGLIGGGLITLIFAARFGRRYPAELRALGLSGLAFMLTFSAVSICFIYAVRETTVANTLFLVSVSPVFSALISWAVLGEAPDRVTVRTIALALGGVAIIAFGGAGDPARPPNAALGDLAALGAAAFLAIGFTITRRARARSMTPVMGLSGLLTALIAAAFVEDFSVPPHAVAPLLAMAVVIMPIGALCLTLGPRYIPAAEVSLLLLIEAVTAPILVWLALGEQPGPATLIGGAVVLGALAWSSAERLGARQG